MTGALERRRARARADGSGARTTTDARFRAPRSAGSPHWTRETIVFAPDDRAGLGHSLGGRMQTRPYYPHALAVEFGERPLEAARRGDHPAAHLVVDLARGPGPVDLGPLVLHPRSLRRTFLALWVSGISGREPLERTGEEPRCVRLEFLAEVREVVVVVDGNAYLPEDPTRIKRCVHAVARSGRTRGHRSGTSTRSDWAPGSAAAATDGSSRRRSGAPPARPPG